MKFIADRNGFKGRTLNLGGRECALALSARPSRLRVFIFLMVLLNACGHGDKLTGNTPKPSWPCGGDIAIPGKEIGNCQ